MLPLAHVMARRRLDEKRKQHIVDMSPHKVRPLVGLRRRELSAPLPTASPAVGDLIVPTGTYVDISVDKQETVYKIMMVHTDLRQRLTSKANSNNNSSGASSSVEQRTDAVDFYFPVSECGKLISVKVEFNKKELQGEMLRESRHDHRFIPSSSKEQFLACSSDDEHQATNPIASAGGAAAAASAATTAAKTAPLRKTKLKRSEASFFYYRVPFVLQQSENANLSCVGDKVSRPPPATKKLDIYIEVRIKTIEKVALSQYRVLFPLLCLPQPPSSLRCEVDMPHYVRRMWTANHRHRVHPFLNNRKAEFSLIFAPENPLNLEDYLFDIEIELGEPIVPECIDPVSLLIMATAVGLMVFYTLTKDLVDDF